MNSNDTNNKIYFNQNMIYFKDKTYNSGGSLEVSFSNSTIDYKTFSTPNLYIAVIGENNLRRMCNLSYVDSVDLYSSFKDIISNIKIIYSTGNSNVLIKKYQYDRTLKFEFIKINNGDEVVSISIIHSNSDFAKVVVPYSVFFSFSVGILKYFVNEYVKISFMFTNRNLLTQILEENKQIKNGIITLPSSLVYSGDSVRGVSPQVALESVEEDFENSNNISETMNDFDNFLGKDMENIKVPDLENKSLVEDKPKNLEITSPLINKTLNRDLSVLESMITASITRPDPMVTLFEGFRRSMNLDNSVSFLPYVQEKDLKSLLYIAKIYHDLYLNMYVNQNKSLPSSFQILKYKIEDLEKVDYFNIQLAYDLLLIMGYMKIFRSKMESRDSDGNRNGSIFYARLRTFLDPIVYSFLDENKGKIILTYICSNFEIYNNVGFFNHYQEILKENNFEVITTNDVKNFVEELNEKVLKAGILEVTIDQKHSELFRVGFFKLSYDNNLNKEQIVNELVPLEVYSKIGIDTSENSQDMVKILENNKISKEVLDVFYSKGSEVKSENSNKKEQQSNLSKVVRFFNDEVPLEFRDVFYKYIDEEVKLENYNFHNEKIRSLELGENIVKSIYVWNETDNKKEPYTIFRTKLEECILTKDLIIAKYEAKNENFSNEEWNLDFM